VSGVNLSAAVPTSPIVNEAGELRPEWRQFFIALQLRTGGNVGQSSDTSALQEQITAETAARTAADTALTTGLTNEANTRASEDHKLSLRIQSISNVGVVGLQNEIAARQAADALLVPKAQLCSLWAACNLAFLPTSDPGLGKPWLNAGVMTVGAATGTYDLALEDGTGRWTIEDPATFDWLWG
jgi:hypothetical protein